MGADYKGIYKSSADSAKNMEYRDAEAERSNMWKKYDTENSNDPYLNSLRVARKKLDEIGPYASNDEILSVLESIDFSSSKSVKSSDERENNNIENKIGGESSDSQSFETYLQETMDALMDVNIKLE